MSRRLVRPRGMSAVALLALAACGDPMGPSGKVKEITELPRQLSVEESDLIAASNHFAFDLLHQASSPEENLFLSPLSASMALGMAMNGTAGETLDQMRATLGFGDMSLDDIDASYRSLIDLLLGLDDSVEMGVANSVWSDVGFPVRSSFLDAVKLYFGAEAEELDFSSSAAPARINGWVDDATKGRIQSIVPSPIPPEMVMYLINAIYFKGTWTMQFDPKDTREATFHLADGSTQSVKLMEQESEMPYRETDLYQAADLPYGGKAFSMSVVLPAQGVALGDVVAALDGDSWGALTDGFQEAKVTLSLPRFRMSYKRTLNDDLKALGMTDAFSDGLADFSRLSPATGLYISEVLQKTWVEVNEEGTEAAAATSVGVGVTSAPLRVTMRVDRPFLFVLRERLSGTILFLGQVVAPPTG